jgi:hypothetical protein
VTASPAPSAARTVDYRGFAAWRLDGATTSATLVPELGGRIMSFRLHDEPHDEGIELLWQAADPRALKVRDLPEVRHLTSGRRALGPLHYGGHKTWIAPQASWGDGVWPFLDLDNGTWAFDLVDERVVELISPVCRETGIQLARRVAYEASALRVTERLTNRGEAPAVCGLWSVTQLAGRARVRFPVDERGVVDLSPAGAGAPAVVRTRQGVAEVDCCQRGPTKVGTPHAGGWLEAALAPRPGAAVRFTKRYEARHAAAGDWPHGCAVEVYDFAPGSLPCVEVELLSPVTRLRPGDSVGFTERWTADRLDERRWR